MIMATRSNGFPNLAMGNNTNEKTSQPLASTFSHSAWQPGGIWGNGSISLNSRREAIGSRESGETSPNTASGSAQLGTHSQATPWAPRGGIWNQTGNAHPGSSTSGTASPTRTRDNFQHSYPEPHNNTSHGFQLRPPVSQNGSAPPSRTIAPGPLDPSTSSFTYPGVFGDPLGDDRVNGNMYASNNNSQLDVEASNLYRRNSNDPSFNFGHNRQATLTSRQPEPSVPTPSHQYGDNSHRSINRLPGHARQLSQRPSLSGASVALPSDLGRTDAYGFGTIDASTHDLEESFRGGLSLEDAAESTDGGYAANGQFNPATQPFQFNPGSQPWHNAGPANSMGFNQNGPDSSWADPMSMALKNPRKSVGVGERGTPRNSYRPNTNSSGFSGTPNGQTDSWSRPGSRDPRTLPELERAHHNSQYPNQQPGFYPSEYYVPGVSQFPNPFQQYTQGPNFRSQVQASGYVLPADYVSNVPVPVRPSRDQDPGRGMRSAVLEEFRSNAKSNKRYELKDIYNYIVEFSGDQHGSRFIQEKLQTANSDEKDQVFREIEPNTRQLMKDVFGNYVIQKFFEHGNQVQKKIIAAQMKGKVAELSTQMYACRVVQKALEHVLVEQQVEIVDELKPDIIRIVKDQNGNHVIQKVIQMVPHLCIPFIMEAFQSQIESLAAHNYGCRVIQRMLEHGTETEKKILMSDLHTCAARLITDQYGNYVTQHIIARGEPEDRRRVIQLVLQKVLVYSRHKFASNVVEKSIEFGTNEDRRAIRNQLTSPDGNGNNQLQVIMKDQFGNYVIQKLMQHLEGEDLDSFVKEMKPHFVALKKHSTGRQITALDKLMAVTSTALDAPNGTLSNSPTTPSLVVETNSAAPTPLLTMEQNSPESSSPPSTNASIEESMVETDGKLAEPGRPRPAVEVNEQ